MGYKPSNLIVNWLKSLCDGRYKGLISFSNLLQWGSAIHLIYTNENSRATTGDVNQNVLLKVNVVLENIVDLQTKCCVLEQVKDEQILMTRQIKKIEKMQAEILQNQKEIKQLLQQRFNYMLFII